MRHIKPACYRRFIQHCKDYITAVGKEAELRENDLVLDVDSFQILRRENSAVRFCFGLFGYVLGLDLPDEIYEHPVMMSMHLAAVDMVCWSNVSTNRIRVLQKALNRPSLSLGPILIQHGASHGTHWQQYLDRVDEGKKH